MKISYRREMKHNYLIVDPESLMWRNYECRMLSKNAINGVLPFQLRQIDDEIQFYYEITSRQPLSRMLENHPIRELEIRQLILGISRILDRMEPYLLQEKIVLLEPDYIYVEPETFQIWLCLIPGLERDFPEDYGKLLEYLLGKADHQDKETVILAYGLYQETRKENYGMDDILRLLTNGKENKTHPQNTPEMFDKESVIREQTIRPSAEQFKQKKTKDEEVIHRAEKTRDDSSKKRLSVVEKIKKWFQKAYEGQKEDSEEVQKESWELLFRDEVNPEVSRYSFVPMQQTTERREGMIPERIMDEGRNTTLLADLSVNGTADVKKLYALDPGKETIVICYYPFVIGKQKNLVDYYLDHETVSRLHVRIDQSGDGWIIQDLNSSNGTMVSGKLLENNEAAALVPGDEVRIAELRYRFE